MNSRHEQPVGNVRFPPIADIRTTLQNVSVANHGTVSQTQLVLVAAAFTALAVAPFEAVSFYKGAYPGWWIGLLCAPPAIALTFYSSTRARLLAWVFLSLLGALVFVAVDVVLWFA
jgi:hypothetical protein